MPQKQRADKAGEKAKVKMMKDEWDTSEEEKGDKGLANRAARGGVLDTDTTGWTDFFLACRPRGIRTSV